MKRSTGVARLTAGLLAGLAVLATGSAAGAAPTSVPGPAPTAVGGTVAEDALSWSVRPADRGEEQAEPRPNFVYEVEPGEVVQDGMVVTNLGAEIVTLEVYAADALTTASGQLDLLAAGQESVGVGAWVRVDADRVELAPGEEREITFTLTVPQDAAPGDHAGGLLTSYVSVQEGSTVALDRRLGSRVHVRVAGDLAPALLVEDLRADYAFSWNPFAPSSVLVTYRVTNTGNARMVATELVGVSDPLGGAVGAPLAEVPELLPGASLEREVLVEGVWPWVRLAAEVELLPLAVGSGGGAIDPLVAASPTWAVPWALLVLVVLVVVAAVWVPTARARRSGRAATAGAAATPGRDATAGPDSST